MSKLTSFLVSIGINNASVELIGGKIVGWGSALDSKNAGGYMDPDFIQGYRFNPSDKGWYSTPPSPAYGNYAWSNPASSSMQATLSQIQSWRNQNNQIEGVTSTNGVAGTIASPSLIFDILGSGLV